ncbi:GNAT family N-acetyltransferase [Fusibacter ferrireducens]|uniref:GNAT family N-acetyltransferase n=1 Tax=Fusibacter ferrireducens TaxID=2785058 RepID=A0ABR9ZR66_9FIRM|nr:GNAT family N-acetyltransferase [Fusibacter ferrireducens]MBF4692950.1 GNAT family N-acetyltransferase [Fusibacter ferrireducens]
MIRKMELESDYENVREMVYKMPAQNYFICMAFEMSISPFREIMLCEDNHHTLTMVLFYRKSGNLQIAIHPDYNFDHECGQAVLKELKAHLNHFTYQKLIISKSIFKKIEAGVPHEQIEKQAEIHHLIMSHPYEMNLAFESTYRFRKLQCEDLDEVESLYRMVFNGFASKDYMKQKIKSGRGMGYGVWKDQKLVSAAQTDFENRILVGVATHPAYQHLGLSRKCVQILLNAIYTNQKEIYLQVENPIAIRFYKTLGFNVVDLTLYVTNF